MTWTVVAFGRKYDERLLFLFKARWVVGLKINRDKSIRDSGLRAVPNEHNKCQESGLPMVSTFSIKIDVRTPDS